MSAENYPISIKFVMQMKIFIPRCTFYKQNDFFQIQDGERTPYWKLFLPISRRHIGQLVRNSDRRWRITYRSRHQIGNFCKLKMADSRHFENDLMSISWPWITRLRSNFVPSYKYSFRGWTSNKDRNISNSSSQTDAILKIIFGYVSARPPQRRNPLTDLDVSWHI